MLRGELLRVFVIFFKNFHIHRLEGWKTNLRQEPIGNLRATPPRVRPLCVKKEPLRLGCKVFVGHYSGAQRDVDAPAHDARSQTHMHVNVNSAVLKEA